jgi:hypothetical protein
VRFEGRIWKEGKHWLVEVPILDLMTQGRTRKEALTMVIDAMESLANQKGFRARFTILNQKQLRSGRQIRPPSLPSCCVANAKPTAYH